MISPVRVWASLSRTRPPSFVQCPIVFFALSQLLRRALGLERMTHVTESCRFRGEKSTGSSPRATEFHACLVTQILVTELNISASWTAPGHIRLNSIACMGECVGGTDILVCLAKLRTVANVTTLWTKRLERHNYVTSVCARKLWKGLKFSEGSRLKRVIASLALLLGLTFVTLTLYLGNVEAVVKVLQSYAVSFP